MREDNYPHPLSDPEAEGLPATADPDTTAYDEVESARISDGPDPGPLPGDEALAVDRYGTTPEEARLGEPLAYKLMREEPDIPSRPSAGEPVGRLVEPDQGAENPDEEPD